MDMWVMYLDSWYYSEQLLCINHFNPNYGLKVIDLTGSGQLPDRRIRGGRCVFGMLEGGGGPTGSVSGFDVFF